MKATISINYTANTEDWASRPVTPAQASYIRSLIGYNRQLAPGCEPQNRGQAAQLIELLKAAPKYQPKAQASQAQLDELVALGREFHNLTYPDGRYGFAPSMVLGSGKLTAEDAAAKIAHYSNLVAAAKEAAAAKAAYLAQQETIRAASAAKARAEQAAREAACTGHDIIWGERSSGDGPRTGACRHCAKVAHESFTILQGVA
jgi:hypothetical protein